MGQYTGNIKIGGLKGKLTPRYVLVQVWLLLGRCMASVNNQCCHFIGAAAIVIIHRLGILVEGNDGKSPILSNQMRLVTRKAQWPLWMWLEYKISTQAACRCKWKFVWFSCATLAASTAVANITKLSVVIRVIVSLGCNGKKMCIIIAFITVTYDMHVRLSKDQ